jgi:hypothetical protein
MVRMDPQKLEQDGPPSHSRIKQTCIAKAVSRLSLAGLMCIKDGPAYLVSPLPELFRDLIFSLLALQL